MQKIKEILAVIIIITLLASLCAVISYTDLDKIGDVKVYNHGICTNCANGRYKVFEAEGITRYFLKCDKCDHIIKVYSQIWLTDENYEREGGK